MVMERDEGAYEIFLMVFVEEKFGKGRLCCEVRTFHLTCGFDEAFFVLGNLSYNTLSETDRLFQECATPHTATLYRANAR